MITAYKREREMPTLFCKDCGEKLSADSKFCTQCGTKVPNAKATDAEENIHHKSAAKVSDAKNGVHIFKILLLIVLGVIIYNVYSGTQTLDVTTPDSSQQSTANTATPVANKSIKIGEPARDGKFEFVVSSIECGKATVGSSEYLNKTAQGQYCLLNISVKNIGNEPQSLFSSNQLLFNAKGQKFAADDTATLYAAPSGTNAWYTEINPGNTVSGVIVFDIAKDTTPVSAELHDSAYSGGVKVAL